jgi:hypothetical protein
MKHPGDRANLRVSIRPRRSREGVGVDLVSIQHNWYVVLMVPSFENGMLPPGECSATWNEIEATFGGSPWRDHLLGGCRRALDSLAGAGCATAWLDGSFVTNKLLPGDIDCCYDPIGVQVSLLHPALLDFSPGRPSQKAEFGCEFFPNIIEAGSGTYFVEFFQHDRDGQRKGIIVINLKELKP